MRACTSQEGYEMTNYERICADKAFCAYVVMGTLEDATFEEAMQWLDTEQIEVSDERAQEAGKGEAE